MGRMRRGRPGMRRMNAGPRRAGGGRKANRLSGAMGERLEAAHRARKEERFSDAATEFAHVASRANEHGMHPMAVHTALLAVRCWVRTGDREAALAEAVKATRYAAPIKDGTRTSRRFGVVIAKLRANGHDADADALEAAVKEALGVTRLPSPDPANAPTANRAMRRSLPKACGTCGAPVEAAKVSFSEEGAADCRFCGTVLVG